jgi:hypothetical protein
MGQDPHGAFDGKTDFNTSPFVFLDVRQLAEQVDGLRVETEGFLIGIAVYRFATSRTCRPVTKPRAKCCILYLLSSHFRILCCTHLILR